MIIAHVGPGKCEIKKIVSDTDNHNTNLNVEVPYKELSNTMPINTSDMVLHNCARLDTYYQRHDPKHGIEAMFNKRKGKYKGKNK